FLSKHPDRINYRYFSLLCSGFPSFQSVNLTLSFLKWHWLNDFGGRCPVVEVVVSRSGSPEISSG
ncbi:MAG: hypothetical protein ACK4ZT_18820, partial [Microcystis sp.]|uniref:hypothetical protein n=1 Tax=Microcystis sp. TaxID=1127 RepID=UPI003919C928